MSKIRLYGTPEQLEWYASMLAPSIEEGTEITPPVGDRHLESLEGDKHEEQHNADSKE